MNTFLKTAALFTIVLGLAVTAFAESLPVGKWKLDSYKFGQKIADPISKELITLNIDSEGKIGGLSGCNVDGGSYSFAEGKLQISEIFSTMMACEEPLMSFERTFYETLRSSDRFTLVDGVLTITDGDAKSFVRFTRVRKPKPHNMC